MERVVARWAEERVGEVGPTVEDVAETLGISAAEVARLRGGGGGKAVPAGRYEPSVGRRSLLILVLFCSLVTAGGVLSITRRPRVVAPPIVAAPIAAIPYIGTAEFQADLVEDAKLPAGMVLEFPYGRSYRGTARTVPDLPGLRAHLRTVYQAESRLGSDETAKYAPVRIRITGSKGTWTGNLPDVPMSGAISIEEGLDRVMDVVSSKL